MRILESLRTKFAADLSDSLALTQELDTWLAKQNKNEQDAQAVRDGLALDAIRSIDGGKTSTDKLERLGREHTAIEATIAALRTEIAEARAAEKAAEIEAAWDESRRLGGELLSAAEQADAAGTALADALAKLKQAQVSFEVSLPERRPGFASMIAGSASSFCIDRIRYLLLPTMARPVPTLESMAKDEVAVALRMRPSTTTDRQDDAQSR